MSQQAIEQFAPDDELPILSEHYQKRRFLHAKQYAAQLLRDYPNDYRLHNFLGETLAEMGHLREAMQSLQRARQLNERQPQIYLNIGNLFLRNAQFKEAIEYYDAALHFDKGFVDAMCNRATALAKMNRVEEAIAAYEAVIAQYPDRPLIHYNLMEILEKSNREEHLRRAVKSALDAGINHPAVLLFEGAIAAKDGDAARAVEILEPLEFNSFGVNQQNILRANILMHAYDKLNEVDKAIEHCDKLHELCVAVDHVPSDLAKRYQQQLQHTATSFSELDRKKWDTHGLTNPHPNLAFLVGWPRSGTTLLDTSLRGHPDIDVVEEEPMVAQMMRTFNALEADAVSHMEDFTAEKQKTAIAAYMKELEQHARFRDDGVMIDKLPLNISQAGYIERVFPNAKFILSLRHPCDCILSCYMNRFTINAAMANFLTLESTVALYDRVMNMWLELYDQFDLNVFTLKYEEMVEDREPVLRGLLEFLELDWHDDVLDHQKTAMARGRINTPSYSQVIQPIYKNARYRWQRYEKYFEPHMDVLNKWITHWGYK